MQNIASIHQNPVRIAGILLISSFLIPFLALVILITSGAFSAFSAAIQDSLAEMAPYANTFRLLNTLWTAGWIVQLLGFGLLSRLLLGAGDESMAIPAFFALLVAVILGVLHGTFHMSVETWAAEEAAFPGTIPEIYEPLEIWISNAFRVGYIVHLAATAGFGWSILRTRLLPSWAGWFSLGWGVLWFAGILVGVGLPAVLFIMPALIGAALLIKSGEKSV
jgi:hypothetical protein